MILFPAIDMYEGKAVRLLHGDYRQLTVYSENPVAVACEFARAGATHIHLVDLEGARDGSTPHLPLVKEIVRKSGLFAEIGGGIRSMETIRQYLDVGVGRVILGTAAVQNPAFLREAVEAYGERIAVGADVRDGRIATSGWLSSADVSLEAFLADVQKIGVQYVICTDISRDGAMRGSNLALYQRLSEAYSMHLTASGGVSTLEDIRQLREMKLYGAIIGKAYYTGAIDLRTALEAAR